MDKKDEEFEELFRKLHKEKALGYLLANYQGFWFDKQLLKGTITFQNHFQANDTDIILATLPKSGTTWLKALTFSIVNRGKYQMEESPLLHTSPHQLIPFLETNMYKSGELPNDYLNSASCPRIFATHVPYQCLPSFILDDLANCRIIYLCRNLLDSFTSLLHFAKQNGFVPRFLEPVAMHRCLKSFSGGKVLYGPYWDQIIGYWEASSKNPQKILFLKFEDLKRDINSSTRNIAEFLGCPFSAEEEKAGLVEEICKLCSLESLMNMECNTKGETEIRFVAKNSSFFRKGEVGDWVNCLTPSMAEKLQKVMEEKFHECGLTFEIQATQFYQANIIIFLE
ncbi:OLC1v1030479C1 [Oldenlandia corymbosa var. corymbosa]|uniref:Sulfotransferase n=1 Tax=Oldenlandia corymbosa var. corymbosa TaxID=529605 RepID=A0AAV1CJR8_OLDCO|nr:OLC1v1030479C1 [Oldenlandia corymbosa var. corymbosa]